VFSLVLHALLLGSAAPSMQGLQTAAPFRVTIDCPEHNNAPTPADHSHLKHDRSLCCILCGKLGTTIGLAPVALALPILRPVVLGVISFSQDRQASDKAASVLPVGARAPPLQG
jgi:hypothetical protein